MHAVLEELRQHINLTAQSHKKVHAGIQAYRETLLALTPLHRRLLYETAQSLVAQADLSKRESLWLVPFSQPAFSVFERFVTDQGVWRIFGDFARVLVGGKVSRRARRNKRKNRAVALAHWYSNVLPDVCSHIEQEDNTLLLTTLEHPDEAACDAYLDHCIESATVLQAQRMMGIIQYHPLIELRRLCDEHWSLPSGGGLVFAVREILAGTASMSGITSHLPPTWKKSGKATAVIRDVFHLHFWPRFTHVDSRTIAQLSCTSFKVPDAAPQLIGEGGNGILPKTFVCTRHKLLSVGLKIHCVGKKPAGSDFLTRGHFVAHNAGTCFNLPPVANAEGMIALLELLGARAGVSYLDNPDYQLQVCTPQRLVNRYAAILGILFYLGSDRLRMYGPNAFTTTYQTDRLVIYDANVLHSVFPYYAADGSPLLLSQECFGRTDVLTAQSARDIRNINLVATLLVHAQQGGFFQKVGMRFRTDVESLLAVHSLSGLLDADWINPAQWFGGIPTLSGEERPANSLSFQEALTELMRYAHAEQERVARARLDGREWDAHVGILFSVQQLLAEYRHTVEALTPEFDDA